MQLLSEKNGWTGGQYSLFRGVLGVYLLAHFLQLLPWGAEMFSNLGVLPDAGLSPFIGLFPNFLGMWDSPLAVNLLLSLGAAASLSFAVGFYDRAAGLILWYIWACLLGRNPLIANPSIPYVGWIFLTHAFMPSDPYGSLGARNRVDPGNNWKIPQEIYAAAWIIMAVSYTYSGYTKLISPSWIDGTAFLMVLQNPLARPGLVRELLLSLPVFILQLATWSALLAELAFLPLALFKKLRPWIWLTLVGMHVGLLTIVSFADLSLGMLMMHFLTFDPEWISPLRSASKDKVFYDGECGLCHGAVRFLLAEDEGSRFHLAALQSEAFRESVSEEERRGLPDSIVVVCEDGEVKTRSSAILYIMKRLGGLWRVIAACGSILPLSILDKIYDGLAKVRYRIFSKPPGLCPMMPARLQGRFLS